MVKVPFPPFDDRPINPASKFGCGADPGVTTRTGNNFWHTMVGTLSGTDAYFRKRDICSLTPWGIGGVLDGALDGKVYRWVDFRTTDGIPWSSGRWGPPGIGDGQAYVNTWGVFGINAKAEAIEYSGMVNTPMTAKQWLMGIWLTAAIEHDAGRAHDEALWHMHHREICKLIDNKDCPFPRIYNYLGQYYPAIIALMAHVEGKPNQKLVHTIAGLTIDLRPIAAQAGQPVPKPEPTGPIFQDFTPNRTFTVVPNGATLRQYASRKSTVLATLPGGISLEADGYYFGEKVDGENRWLVQNADPRGRVHLSGVVERI